uniref:PLD phosphodiesterase domain-containing protein n=1 Tax=Chaetoceros debilis TaxID=122233 RepID=A0A7S3Q235_9STRA|mmetsp:Transcript_6816/g.9782  ORF Transcript_6816/g.9782 Transcript_6816/m.9782 type:complete len:573 (+) Transcript_6816:140-1858(+)|eukprot:CAMPEP_0194080442 /NCGR_PEP_ID=MMETSP0149-20130528/6464_1 /TAXON_ID=122233 /ORGANISM="Chaetoceros debilis, Strain MM31A-1" /LENGTH=572 /DNA_ID=CAMNT_0038762157 /DNA_START=114 /DNA_END=1832 /DNA_ORIENTATION=-
MVLCGVLDCFGDNSDAIVDALAQDSSAEKLSYVGKSCYKILQTKHAWHHHKLWNVTSGKTIGSLHQTPKPTIFSSTDAPEDGHDDWFPVKMFEIMSRTTVWCDVMSLGPPDGIFLTKFNEALKTIAENAKDSEKPVIVRFLMGNIVGMPTNCNSLVTELTKGLPDDANIQLWVGAWRKGASWNHAKLIAADGRYLHTGGHNLWDAHYLKNNPVHDLSIEMEGRVAHDGHLYANAQWQFIERKQSTCGGQMVDHLPDSVPLIWKTRVTVSEYPPIKAAEFPPMYSTGLVPTYDKPEGSVPVLSLGRYGSLTIQHRPADDAFIAMFDSAKKIIRMSLQDLGPVCIPKTKVALPGCTWPKPYLDALARAIWLREVDVEIVVSNPGSIPGGLTPLEANYGNGWSCVDCAAEIIKRIKKQFRDADDVTLRKKVEENLRICFIRHDGKNTYDDGKSIGNHSKFFIIDDIAAYTGSQNLYVCDLAEWGVVVDDETETQKMLEDFWNPLWKSSYTETDCDVQEVMDGLDIDRDGEVVNAFSADGRKKMDEAAKMTMLASGEKDMYDTCEESTHSAIPVAE